MAKFSKSFLDNLEIKDKQYSVSDDACEGLSVRILPTGSKTYFARLQLDGKRFRKTIGKVENVKLVDAREIATAILQESKSKQPKLEESLNLEQLFQSFEQQH